MTYVTQQFLAVRQSALEPAAAEPPEAAGDSGRPTLYLVRGDDDEHEDWDHDRDRGDLSTTTSGLKKKRDVRVWPKVPTCDGPYRSFGTWSGTVPY